MKRALYAGPGSGKTRAIEGFLREDRGVPAGRCCAITFTREAALSLRERIGDPNIRCSTIHSLAYELCDGRPDIWSSSQPYAELLARATAILEREQEQGIRRFDVAALDEAQDLNAEQYRFVRTLFAGAPDILIVGDQMQSIFTFNGSDPRFMMQLTDDLDLETESLMQSHRFGRPIASFVNGVFGTAITTDDREGEVVPVRTDRPWTVAARERIGNHQTGVLVRTNAQILQLIQGSEDHRRYNYTLSMASHPLVAMAACSFSQEHIGMNRECLIAMARFIGAWSWSLHRYLTSLPGSQRITRPFLEELFLSFGLRSTYGADRKRLGKGMRHMINLLDLINRPTMEEIVHEIRAIGYQVSDNQWAAPLSDEEIIASATELVNGGDPKIRIDNGASTDIMTIHAAKGLEFDEVIVYVPEHAYATTGELRVWYVAFTRARRRLTLIIGGSLAGRDNEIQQLIDNYYEVL